MYPPYQAPPPPPQNDGGATASLVLGILGLLLCSALSPIALAMGISSKRRIRESGGYIGGEGSATAGVVLGAIGTAFLAIALIFLVFLVIIAAANGNSST